MSTSATKSAPLVPPRMLFRFSAPCHRLAKNSDALAALKPKHRLPELGILEGTKPFADVRVAWSNDGLSVTLVVAGKSEKPWCRESRATDSDGLQLWIDTRDTHTIHRASRFCHHFVFLSAGAGRGFAQPVATLLPIHRARENPKPVGREQLQLQAQQRKNGYALAAHIPAAALTGFDPAEHPRLGFNYLVLDRELGEQTFSCPTHLPVAEDPSLWGSLELLA